MRDGNAERGFTLVELMIVVAVIAVLALVVVPMWMSETTKAKRTSEVSAMFAEIAVKQEQFKQEQGKYMGNTGGANYVGTTACPSSVPTADYNFSTSCVTTGSAWAMLRIEPTKESLRCQYSITAGLAGTTLTPPTGFKNSQGAAAAEPALARGWWYLLATCDDKAGGTNATYYMSSVDRLVQAQNEGH